MRPKATSTAGRIDSWDAGLTEAQRWQAYDKAGTAPWYEFAAWAKEEFGLSRQPGRSAVYRWKDRMRGNESAHRVEETITAKREVGTMAKAAGIDNQDLISAYITMGADLAMRTGVADDAKKFTGMAMDLAAAQCKMIDLDLKRRSVAATEKAVAERIKSDREKAVDALLEEAKGNARATELLNQFLSALEKKTA